MLIIIFLLYMCYHFVFKIKQLFLLHTKPHNIFNYFQRTAYSELIMFWYYTLQTKNFTRVIEKLKIVHMGYLFDEECTSIHWRVNTKSKPYNYHLICS